MPFSAHQTPGPYFSVGPHFRGEKDFCQTLKSLPRAWLEENLPRFLNLSLQMLESLIQADVPFAYILHTSSSKP